MSGLFGSSQGGTTTTVQTNGMAPWVTDAANRAANLANNGAYSGPFIAAQSPTTQQAYDLTSRYATQGSPGQALLNNYASGQYLDPRSNPYFSTAVADALGQTQSALNSQYGGAAGANLNNSGFQENMARTLGNVANTAYANQYNQNVAQQQQAAQIGQNLQYQNLAALQGVGSAQDQYNQAAIQAQQQQFYSPWTPVQNYAAILAGTPSAGQSTSSPYFTNPAATALGLGIGGVSLYNMGKTAGLWGA